MDAESHRRQLREYLWFAMILMGVLIGSATQEIAGDVTRTQSQAVLTVN